MKYVSFIRPDGQDSFGRVDGDAVLELRHAGQSDNLLEAIASGALPTLQPGTRYAFSSVILLPVIPKPGKILCVGLNYETHRLETGRAEAGYPAMFTRFADTLVAHGQPLIKPRVSDELDYEGELALVIGKGGRAIAPENAWEHVAGYACFNDVSVRDWQKHNIQFTPGKNFPGTGAFGPWLVTPDEISDVGSLHVVTRLNGTVVQDQPVSDMLFDIPAIIAYVSGFTHLSPGDVIATGTPGGVGAKRKPPLWMKVGDTVEVEIGAVGTLVNTIAAES